MYSDKSRQLLLEIRYFSEPTTPLSLHRLDLEVNHYFYQCFFSFRVQTQAKSLTLNTDFQGKHTFFSPRRILSQSNRPPSIQDVVPDLSQ